MIPTYKGLLDAPIRSTIFLSTYMTEAVPLRTALGVQSVQIVKDIGKGVLQRVLKRFAPVEGRVRQFGRETGERGSVLWLMRWYLEMVR